MENVANKMDLKHGRSAMWRVEADLLAEICKTPGDHVEVGTLWGASAIIAAWNKPRPDRIYSIDIMQGGYWTDGDPGTNPKIKPTARAILDNFHHAGVADRITLICAPSNPLPVSGLVSTALIDAAHESYLAKEDWLNLNSFVSRFIALHDVGEQHPGVASMVERWVLTDPRWRKYKQAHSLLVMERVE